MYQLFVYAGFENQIVHVGIRASSDGMCPRDGIRIEHRNEANDGRRRDGRQQERRSF